MVVRDARRIPLEIPPTSKRGPDELWAESAEKVLPEVLLGTWLGVPEKCRKTAENVLEMLKTGAGHIFSAVLRHFFRHSQAGPESTSGSTFSALSARSSSGAPLAGQQNLKCTPCFASL